MTGYHVLLRRSKEGEETFIVCVSDMGNTGTDLDPRHGYHVKAKNAHGLSDVSNFARIDTLFLSENTANATMRLVHGQHNSTLKNPAHHHGGCTMHMRYSRITARLTVAGDTPKDLATRR